MPDENVIADFAAVQDRPVTHRDAVTHHERQSRIRVHHGAVLDVRLLADDDPFLVRPNHRSNQMLAPEPMVRSPIRMAPGAIHASLATVG